MIKGLANRCLIEWHRRQRPEEGPWLMSGEDLANVGPVALLNDLAAMAVFGIEDVERNGHHYFHGLDHLPPSEAEAALSAHPDLYRRVGDSICLRITGGDIECASLQCTGFGYGGEIALGERVPLDEWKLTE